MSAWTQLVNGRGDDEWLALCSEALDEVQRETKSRLAARLAAAGFVQASGFIVGGLLDPEDKP